MIGFWCIIEYKYDLMTCLNFIISNDAHLCSNYVYCGLKLQKISISIFLLIITDFHGVSRKISDTLTCLRGELYT